MKLNENQSASSILHIFLQLNELNIFQQFKYAMKYFKDIQNLKSKSKAEFVSSYDSVFEEKVWIEEKLILDDRKKFI